MTDLRNHARFVGPDVPVVEAEDEEASDWPSEPVPPGAGLARKIEAALAALEWRTPNRWVTDFGHAFDCERSRQRWDVVVQAVDAEEERWLLTATPRTGLLRRKKRVDEAEYRTLLVDLHRVLAADDAVTEVAWFTADEWANDATAPGADAP